MFVIKLEVITSLCSTMWNGIFLQLMFLDIYVLMKGKSIQSSTCWFTKNTPISLSQRPALEGNPSSYSGISSQNMALHWDFIILRSANCHKCSELGYYIQSHEKEAKCSSSLGLNCQGRKSQGRAEMDWSSIASLYGISKNKSSETTFVF